MKIRLACEEDWETLTNFNIRLAEETEGKRLDRVTITSGVQRLLANAQHGRYFVACDGEKIIGQMMHTREWSDWRNGEIWWLQSVYVHPDHRRQGIFRSLYRHLESLARETPDVVGVRLYVEQHNQNAVEVYRSLGLDNAGYTVMEMLFQSLT